MALMSKPLPPRPDLDALIVKARAAWDAMPPEKQRQHRAAQRRSWVIGEMMIEHPDMTREYAETLYDKII